MGQHLPERRVGPRLATVEDEREDVDDEREDPKLDPRLPRRDVEEEVVETRKVFRVSSL